MRRLALWVGELHTPVEGYEKPQENAYNDNSKNVLQALEIQASKLHFTRKRGNGDRAEWLVGEGCF